MTRIYYLSTDSALAPQLLTDDDVIRMPIEIGQVLITAWHKAKPGKFERVITYLYGDPWLNWVYESADNYEELWNYAMDLVDEHFHRFGYRTNPPYRHGIKILLDKLSDVPPLPAIGLTPKPLTEEQARLAYNPEGPFARYTHRPKPNLEEVS